MIGVDKIKDLISLKQEGAIGILRKNGINLIAKVNRIYIYMANKLDSKDTCDRR